jgi:HD-like signal output (HDOD) protein
MSTLKEAVPVRMNKNFEMPTVPVVLMRILQLVDDNRASARKLEELILHDPSLSARILKLANSAFYSFQCEVRTISHAIALLGLNLVRSLAIGVSIFEAFTKGMRDQVHNITRLGMHSFGVGLIAQEIQARRACRTDAEFALLCGLLHDLGEIVFFKHDPKGYSSLFAMEKNEDERDICSAEIEQYGIAHTTMGSMLARHWGLPPDLATVARYHHDPMDSGSPLVLSVALADSLAKQAGIGYDGDNRPIRMPEQIRAELHMEEQEWQILCAFADGKRKDVEDFFLSAS